jgi:hypothetical protein
MRQTVLGLELMLTFALAGCAYALHPVTPPAQVNVKVVANSPEDYRVRLRVNDPHEYRVPADGRMTLDIPAYRAGCSASLFGIVNLPNRSDPYTAKTVDLLAGSKAVRQLSLKRIFALPLDVEGYHLLRLPPAK